VFFLDNAPFDDASRDAFQAFMEAGGGFMGFHVTAWTDNPSRWSWFYDDFLGSGSYWKNTWRPTSATLKVESPSHAALQGLSATFMTAPNEWYAFHGDLVNNPAIEILLSIDPVSFPLGTNGSETWMSGYYPVVWSNRNYRMIYANMGHDDMDYGGTNQPLSSTFQSEAQNQFFLDAIRFLGGVTGAP
jgi:type 1 glutamine amidotransferase